MDGARVNTKNSIGCTLCLHFLAIKMDSLMRININFLYYDYGLKNLNTSLRKRRKNTLHERKVNLYPELLFITLRIHWCLLLNEIFQLCAQVVVHYYWFSSGLCHWWFGYSTLLKPSEGLSSSIDMYFLLVTQMDF